MDKLIREFKKRIQEITQDPQLQIILFGSRSRRDHSPDSDDDILIISKNKDIPILKAVEELEIDFFLRTSAIINSHFFTPEEIEALHFEPFIINALREGKAA